MDNKLMNHPGTAYEIRVKNHLEKHWAAYFAGWSIENLENGEVVLQALHVDQAGLHGALNKIRDLNLILISVKPVMQEALRQS